MNKNAKDYIEMVLTEAYSGWLSLREFADNLKDVKRDIHNLSGQIIEHIVKIIIYGEQTPDTIHHWEAEIVAGLNKCMKTKIKRKGKDSYPNKVELLTWLNDKYSEQDDMYRLVSAIECDYPNLKVEKSEEQIWKQLQEILERSVAFVINTKITINDLDTIVKGVI